MCVRVCVCARALKGEKESDRERDIDRECIAYREELNDDSTRVYARVCLCVRGRERERGGEKECITYREE